MINREIMYERTGTGSIMKIAACSNAGVDERLILRRKLSGVLPMEKAYIDGGGQYWYNISGKQSLDTYCRMKEISMEFVEQLIVSICGLMERLEWNLINTQCLMLDPELIFVNHTSRELLFTLYPGGNQPIEQEFQMMMEYLIKKLDHKDTQAVRTVYRIYEQTLESGYQIADIRSLLIREKNAAEETTVRESFSVGRSKTPAEPCCDVHTSDNQPGKSRKGDHRQKNIFHQEGADGIWAKIKEKLVEWGIIQRIEPVGKEKAGNRFKKSQKSLCTEPRQEIIYPDDIMEMEQEPVPVIHPTVCLTGLNGQASGELRYMGSENYADIQLKSGSTRIGHGNDADVNIDRETVSQLHARIYKEEDDFYIEDLNSTNGTFVNEKPLAYKEQKKLSCNDIVQFADIRYRFH